MDETKDLHQVNASAELRDKNVAGRKDLFLACHACLMIDDPYDKAAQVQELYKNYAQLERSANSPAVERIETPGIPERPLLVDPRSVKRRGFGSAAGKLALLHALAHIEFNAINLALDAAYRFRDMPEQYAHDWLLVAADESRHFLMVAERLSELDSHYGALDAHAGLWNMDEIRHVQIGNHWFRYCCEQRGLTPADVFEQLLRQHSRGYLRSPFNEPARVQAGFSTEELDALKVIEAEWED